MVTMRQRAGITMNSPNLTERESETDRKGERLALFRLGKLEFGLLCRIIHFLDTNVIKFSENRGELCNELCARPEISKGRGIKHGVSRLIKM